MVPQILAMRKGVHPRVGLWRCISACMVRNMPPEGMVTPLAFSRLIRQLREKVFGVTLAKIAESGGPGTTTQTEIESERPSTVTDKTVRSYFDAYQTLRPGVIHYTFLPAALIALQAAASPNDELQSRIDSLVSAGGHRRALLFGCNARSAKTVTGSALALPEADSPLRLLLNSTDYREFQRYAVQVAQRHDAVTLVPASQRHHDLLASYIDNGWQEDADTWAVGQVSPHVARAAVDPLIGVRSLNEALDRAAALGAGPEDIVATAWAILIACTKAAKYGAQPIRMWHKHVQISEAGVVAKVPEADIYQFNANGIAGADATLINEMPSASAIYQASRRTLNLWYEEYTAARWIVDLADDGQSWEVAERTSNLDGESPGRRDLWLYNDTQFPTLPKVLYSRETPNTVLTSTGVTLTTSYAPQVYRWFPVGIGTQYGIVQNPSGTWEPIITG